MNEEDGDRLHELINKIDEEVTRVVDKMTVGLSKEHDDHVRNILTDYFRFWRREPFKIIEGEIGEFTDMRFFERGSKKK